MDKATAMQWSAKLIEALASLPNDTQVHGFNLHLNLDTKPFTQVLAIQLCDPLTDAPAIVGHRYSGWHERRAWFRNDVYFWWAESEADDE